MRPTVVNISTEVSAFLAPFASNKGQSKTSTNGASVHSLLWDAGYFGCPLLHYQYLANGIMEKMMRLIFSPLKKHLPATKFLLIVPIAIFSYIIAQGLDRYLLNIWFAILLSFIAWIYARQGLQPEEKRMPIWQELFVFVMCGAIPGIMVWMFLTSHW